MPRVLLPSVLFFLLAAGCAHPPPPPPLWIDAYHEYNSEAESFFPNEVSKAYLTVAKTRFGLAEQFRSDQKWDDATLSYHLAAATARVGLEAARADWENRKAEECEIHVADARREWRDALRELERTEKVAGRQMDVTRQSNDMDALGLNYVPVDRTYLTLEEAGKIIEESQEAQRLAKAMGVAISDLTGPMRHFLIRAGEGPDQAAKAPYELLAARNAQSIQYRVAAAQAAEGCRHSVDAIAHYHELEKEAVWALVQLERGMKESARTQLEEERLLMEGRQDKLYNALKQFEGKFAKLTQEARGTILSMGDILFETGEAELKQQALYNLVKVATILQQFPDMHVYVEGHTDDVGSEDFNKSLSEARAQTVFNFLHEQGVSLDRMDWYGYGMTKPVVSNTSKENRAKNRRVDIVIGNAND